jgi:hypothetical protein
MKTDINGCSTTPAGQEHYETYYSPTLHATRIQYDYRTPQGQLFSCAAPTLEAARARRDAWLLKRLDTTPQRTETAAQEIIK